MVINYKLNSSWIWMGPTHVQPNYLSPAAAHTGPDDYLTSPIGFLDQQHMEARSEAARRALGSGAVATMRGEGRRRSRTKVWSR